MADKQPLLADDGSAPPFGPEVVVQPQVPQQVCWLLPVSIFIHSSSQAFVASYWYILSFFFLIACSLKWSIWLPLYLPFLSCFLKSSYRTLTGFSTELFSFKSSNHLFTRASDLLCTSSSRGSNLASTSSRGSNLDFSRVSSRDTSRDFW